MIYNFCKNCGSSEVKNTNGVSFFCGSCGHMFYPQPSTAVGAFIVKDNRILLVKRLEEPYRNEWVIPSGFIDYGEDPLHALQREMKEELDIDINNPRLFFSALGKENSNKPILGLYYLIESFHGDLKADTNEIGTYKFFHFLTRQRWVLQRITKHTTTWLSMSTKSDRNIVSLAQFAVDLSGGESQESSLEVRPQRL